MKEIKYVPKQCEEGGEFSGFIMVKLPTFDERYELLDQMGLTVEGTEIKMGESNSFKMIRQMVTASQKFYKSVSIKKKDGTELNSLEDLLSDPACDALLIDVAMAVSRGFRPGKI